MTLEIQYCRHDRLYHVLLNDRIVVKVRTIGRGGKVVEWLKMRFH